MTSAQASEVLQLGASLYHAVNVLEKFGAYLFVESLLVALGFGFAVGVVVARVGARRV